MNGLLPRTPMLASSRQDISNEEKSKPKSFVKPVGIFAVLLACNSLAALYVPIHDCDETFNYWEPTHYISHGYGLQTWEYSPDYAIRSWLYIILHSFIGSFRRLLPFDSKVAEFYFTRYVLALICTVSQTAMYLVVNSILNFRVALIFIISMVFSPGMYHASISFLPSSFSMYYTMLGMSALMYRDKGAKIVQGIAWFSVGGLVGWPFSMILSAPFLVEKLFIALQTGRDTFKQLMRRYIQGITISLVVLILEILVSSLFYRRLVIVPLNIVLYNVLSGPGPNLYGTEAWHFYFRNLLINFNIWFVLAVVSLPLYIIQNQFSRDTSIKRNKQLSITVLIPFYLWLFIFSFQPHKEERFMYPFYPCLCLNAAISLHMLLVTLGNVDSTRIFGRTPGWLKLIIVVSLLLMSVVISFARIYGIITGYSAPLQIYGPLSDEAHDTSSVCFGKEWYRFPSSYHLPSNTRAKFIRSEFRGLLPGDFSETKYSFRSGTWVKPTNMNNNNLEDVGKYVDISTCDFIVDTYYPKSIPSNLEPHYILDTIRWKKIYCVPFLDASRTALLGRVLWVPNLPSFVPLSWQRAWGKKTHRKWGIHCLLKRNTE